MYTVWVTIPFEGAMDILQGVSWEEALEKVRECAGKKKELAVRTILKTGVYKWGKGDNEESVFITSDILKGPLNVKKH